MSNVVMRYPGFKSKALTLSYDDGTSADVKMIEILDKYGIKCTFNINTMCFGADGVKYPQGKYGRLSKKECVELYTGKPHEIAIHTLRHQWLPNLPSVDIINEVREDKKEIENMFGTIVRGGAYPYGATNDTVCDILKMCDIVYCRTTVSTENFNIPEDWLRLPATCHHKSPKFMDLTDRFINNKYCNPWLFYIWGHSYEFERDNEWDLLEEFCKKVGGNPEIWFATNIEIFDYIIAYKALRFSADMNRVYNPSACPVYININGNDAEIPGGATVELK